VLIGLGIVAVLLFIAVVLLWVLSVKMVNERDAARERVKDMELVAASEYDRAMADGKALVRAWAVDANYNLYTNGELGPMTRAAFQDAERQFAPKEGVKVDA